MREGLVGLSHAVDVVLPLPGVALLLGGVEDLVGEPRGHRLLVAGPGELDQPANGERPRATGGHLDRHLVRRASDAPGPDLEDRGELLDRSLQLLDRVVAGPLADQREGVVADLLGDRLLPVRHYLVDHLLDEAAPVERIGLEQPDRGLVAARHQMPGLVVTCARWRDWPSRSRTQGEAFGGAKGKPEDEEMRSARRAIRACVSAGPGISGGLHSVERTALLAVGDPGRIERAANDLVPHARKVLDATASDEHDGVLLEVVPLTGDVAGHLEPVGEANPGDLPKRRVRLLRGHRRDAGADAASLRGGDALLAALTRLQARRRHLLLLVGSSVADELIGVRHGPAW